MRFYGKKPEGACFYAKDPTGKMEVIAWMAGMTMCCIEGR